MASDWIGVGVDVFLFRKRAGDRLCEAEVVKRGQNKVLFGGMRWLMAKAHGAGVAGDTPPDLGCQCEGSVKGGPKPFAGIVQAALPRLESSRRQAYGSFLWSFQGVCCMAQSAADDRDFAFARATCSAPARAARGSPRSAVTIGAGVRSRPVRPSRPPSAAIEGTVGRIVGRAIIGAVACCSERIVRTVEAPVMLPERLQPCLGGVHERLRCDVRLRHHRRAVDTRHA